MHLIKSLYRGLLSFLYLIVSILYTFTYSVFLRVLDLARLSSLYLIKKSGFVRLLPLSILFFISNLLAVYISNVDIESYAFLGLGSASVLLYFVSSFGIMNYAQINGVVVDWFRNNLYREPDVVFIQKVIKCTIIQFPPLVLFCFNLIDSGILIMMFIVSVYIQIYAIEAILHHNMHNKFLRPKNSSSKIKSILFKSIDFYVNYILGPLNFYIPKFYLIHHLYNHHPENGSKKDLTGLLIYDTKSYLDYCRASLKFALSWTTGFDLVSYLYNRHPRQVKVLISNIVLYYAFVGVLLFSNLTIGLSFLFFNLVVGVVVSRNIWFWHCFIDRNDFLNPYKNSNTILMPLDTNDSYHIVHHSSESLHYTEAPSLFEKDREKYIDESSVVLENITQKQLMYALFQKRFDFLSSCYVNLSNEKVLKKDISQMLSSRTEPLEKDKYYHNQYLYSVIERFLVKVMVIIEGIKLPSSNHDYIEPWKG